MNDQMLRDLLRRLNVLERTSARVRVGEVTDVNPLDVALGGSDTSYEGVKAIGAVADADQVATLLWGNDLLVLGPIGGGNSGPLGGIVSGAGAIQAGSEFTVVKNGTGDYTVTFAPTLAAAPVVVVGSAQGAGAIGAKLTTGVLPTATSFQVAVFTTTTGVAVDGAFSFMALA